MKTDLQSIITQLRDIQPQQFTYTHEHQHHVYSTRVLSDNLTIQIEKKVDPTQQPPQETHKLEVWQSKTLLATYEGDSVRDAWNTIDKKVRQYEDERFYFDHGGGD